MRTVLEGATRAIKSSPPYLQVIIHTQNLSTHPFKPSVPTIARHNTKIPRSPYNIPQVKAGESRALLILYHCKYRDVSD